MKSIHSILLASAIFLILIGFAYRVNKKNIWFEDRRFFNRNYIPATTSPGNVLNRPFFSPDDMLNITIDGKMDEDIWEKSQKVNNFYTDNRNPDDNVEVNVISDKESIYLFWKVKNKNPIVAEIFKNDSALVGDDYVQVNLKPIIPDSIKYARDYSFSVAVNTNEAIWDAYFDPYNGGYFFTNWTSEAKLKVIKTGNSYSLEMALPYSGLDIYSDTGWKWDMTFNRAGAGDNLVSTSSTGVTVVQNIKVRHPRMVGYYWPREDFWPDIIPSLKNIENPHSSAVRLKNPPKNNRKKDKIWSDCREIELTYDNKTTELIKGKKAKARVGYDQKNLYLLLESPDPYPGRQGEGDEGHTGGGMSHQLRGLDGVYRDLSLETSESFWILLQPSSENGDAPHQDYYFLTVDYTGKTTQIRYDSHGKPDKNWNPGMVSDIFKTNNDWGIELTISLNSFYIPFDCSNTWRMNIMYNIPLEDGNTIEGLSKIQAWYPTLKDERNPEKTGKISSLDIEYDKYIRQTLDLRVQELSEQIKALKGISTQETDELNSQFRRIRSGVRSEDIKKIKDDLDMLDIRIGIAEEKTLYVNTLDISNEGYPLNDIHFINPEQGFAVGAMGLIMQTKDGGNNWTRQKQITDSNLSDIFFLNEKEGWIAGGRIRSAETNESMSHDERGGDGIILHTTDGGESWEIQFAKRGTYLFGIFFSDSGNGWATGEGGLLMKTTNGGELWTQMPTTGTIKWLNGIWFFDKNNGFLTGESETALSTNDGGETWKKVNAPADRKFYDFKSFYRDITFVGDNGWIVGQNGTILASTDRGKTWKPQATEYDEKVRELMDLKKVFFIDKNRGYAIGGTGTRMLKTENGGESWSMVKVPNNDNLYGIWFDENGKGFIAGGRSKIMKTDDGAKNWRMVNGTNKNIDLLIFSAHGDDSPIAHGFLMTWLSKIENRDIAAIHITRDTHSNEYKGEYYDAECDRSHYMMGVKTVNHFDEFDTGNSGATSFHINLRLWKGYDEMTRHMVAAIRAYKPDVIITHDPIFGEYDKPGHKIAGRSGIMAYYDSGNPDKYPELTGLGLEPHQAKKIYVYATQAFPVTYRYDDMPDVPVEGHGETVKEWANRSLTVFQSQGVHFVRHTPLHLLHSHVDVPDKEKSIFDGIK